ncbi:MAG: molecular chaperone TorD family protein [Chloroflexota bacterium]
MPTSDSNETAAQSALARSRLYWLLGRLLLTGPSADLWPLLDAIEDLRLPLGADPEWPEWAAQHQQIFGFSLFPFGSFFLDTSGMVGGQVAERVVEETTRLGYRPQDQSVGWDHIGVELDCLSFLCAAEGDAWQDNLPQQTQHIRMEAGRFLQDHLLCWLVPCLWAIRAEGNGFYQAVAETTFALVAGHYSNLTNSDLTNSNLAGSPPPTRQDFQAKKFNQSKQTEESHLFTLPEPPSLLDDETTSLRDIATFLMTPPYSGLFISRTTVTAWARALQLPRGFSTRTDMLVNLMQAGVQYDGFSPLITQIETTVQEAHDGYGAYLEEAPALRHAITPWKERTAETVQLLRRIGERANIPD